MPFRIRCANGHALRIQDEFMGKPVRCPTCGNVVRIPAAEPPLQLQPVKITKVFADEDEDDPDAADERRRAKRRRRERRAALAKVRTGVALHVLKISLVILGWMLGCAL